jgi:hypothetical protein
MKAKGLGDREIGLAVTNHCVIAWNNFEQLSSSAFKTRFDVVNSLLTACDIDKVHGLHEPWA